MQKTKQKIQKTKTHQLFPVSEIDTEPYLHYIDTMKLKINKTEKGPTTQNRI